MSVYKSTSESTEINTSKGSNSNTWVLYYQVIGATTEIASRIAQAIQRMKS